VNRKLLDQACVCLRLCLFSVSLWQKIFPLFSRVRQQTKTSRALSDASQVLIARLPIAQVSEARIVRDPRTRESRGFGFITMATSLEADTALRRIDGTAFEGRRLTVEKVSPEGQFKMDNLPFSSKLGFLGTICLDDK
jgi:RNA recognition motif-containing protein